MSTKVKKYSGLFCLKEKVPFKGVIISNYKSDQIILLWASVSKINIQLCYFFKILLFFKILVTYISPQ